MNTFTSSPEQHLSVFAILNLHALFGISVPTLLHALLHLFLFLHIGGHHFTIVLDCTTSRSPPRANTTSSFSRKTHRVLKSQHYFTHVSPPRPVNHARQITHFSTHFYHHLFTFCCFFSDIITSRPPPFMK